MEIRNNHNTPNTKPLPNKPSVKICKNEKTELNRKTAIAKTTFMVVFVYLNLALCACVAGSGTGPLQQLIHSNNNLGMELVKRLCFSSINCNSLNLSSSTKPNQTKKIYAIVKLKSDIIFLSDIRLSTNNVTNAIGRLKRDFELNPFQSYKFLYNSSKNKRGVGILIKNNIGVSDTEIVKDHEENLLAVKLEDTTGNKIIVASIYGPNEYNPQFFNDIQRKIPSLGNYPIIMGSDWNATLCCNPIDSNIDCFRMTNTPNARHSNLIRDLRNNLNMDDPFRYLWPNKSDFSYVAKTRTQTNRSRLDFFLISNPLLPHVTKCFIEPSLSAKCFDHKAIHLDFRITKRKSNRLPAISHAILDDPDITAVVKISVAETYATHSNIANVDDILRLTGRARILLREAGPSPTIRPAEELDADILDERERLVTNLQQTLETINIANLETVNLTCNDGVFMEVLLNNVRNDVTSYQNFIQKTKSNLKKFLREQIALTSLNNDADLTTCRSFSAVQSTAS